MENELIELLEFAKSQKIDFVEYNGTRYNVNDFKFKKYYTIYDKNDFYINECNTLQELQKFLEIYPKEYISKIITQQNFINGMYYIYTTYELAV